MSHLYVHIPFCSHKCGYCDFASTEDMTLLDAYVDALVEEVYLLHAIYPGSLKTLYLGGGTPSVLKTTHFVALVEAIRHTFGLPSDEFTVEVNPESVDLTKMKVLKSLGVNRISMGVQAKQDHVLRVLERGATFDEAHTAYKSLLEAGFDNVSLDLIYGIPGQSLEDVKESVRALMAWSPQHVSTYALKLEAGTPMYEKQIKGDLVLPDDDTYADQFDAIQELLNQEGYIRYEISNFSRPGYESKHNLSYWQGANTLGLGTSAVYLQSGVRMTNDAKIRSYIDQVTKGALPVVDKEVLSDEDRLYEALILGLRLKKGINIQAINQDFKIDFDHQYNAWIKKHLSLGTLEVTDHGYRLTPKGMDIANTLFIDL